MRNFLALVGAATLTFVGLGWYLDWYKLSRKPAPTGTQRIEVDLNPQKISEDVRKGIQRGSEIIDRLGEKPAETHTPSETFAKEGDTQGPASNFFSPSKTIPDDPQGLPVLNTAGWRSLDQNPPQRPTYDSSPRPIFSTPVRR